MLVWRRGAGGRLGVERPRNLVAPALETDRLQWEDATSLPARRYEARGRLPVGRASSCIDNHVDEKFLGHPADARSRTTGYRDRIGDPIFAPNAEREVQRPAATLQAKRLRASVGPVS